MKTETAATVKFTRAHMLVVVKAFADSVVSYSPSARSNSRAFKAMLQEFLNALQAQSSGGNLNIGYCMRQGMKYYMAAKRDVQHQMAASVARREQRLIADIEKATAARQSGLTVLRVVADDPKWSGKVKTKWHPKEGFFKQSQDKIAKGLKRASKDLRQAMDRLDFYINRAGKNLSAKEKERLNGVKPKLRKLYSH